MRGTIIFSDSAVDRIKEILAEEADPTLHLRIFIQGGGCSGFQYGFMLDDQRNEDDYVISTNGVDVVVDMVSWSYLDGATVTYGDDLNGAQFKIQNPNAASTCGCGSSFSVA